MTLTEPIRSLAEALQRCRQLGMRISHQRRLILELLWRSQEHLSARDIYNHLNRQGEKICQTSVYQNLSVLSKHGIIECIERSEGSLYGCFTDSHSHVSCRNTEQVFNIWVELPAVLIEEAEKQSNTKIVDYKIEFYGDRRMSSLPINSASPSTTKTSTK